MLNFLIILIPKALSEVSLLKREPLIGAGSILLPGVKIGKNAFIGAGAVVTKNVSQILWFTETQPKANNLKMIPLINLQKQHKFLKSKLSLGFNEILDSNNFLNHNCINKFEEQFSNAHECKYGALTSVVQQR